MQNPVPQDEQDVIWPIPAGGSMLELGNKKNPNGVYKDYFVSLGLEHISVDWNGQDGALAWDLRDPRPELVHGGKWHQHFDIVTNIGTTEHVIPQGAVWQNILDALKVGGHLVCVTPAPGFWQWHQDKGQYPTEDFYREFAKDNALVVEELYQARARQEDARRENVYARFKKTAHCPAVVIREDLIYVNRRR